MDIVEGSELVLDDLGTVIVRRIYANGAAIVEDFQGFRWLVSAEMFAEEGVFLYSYAR